MEAGSQLSPPARSEAVAAAVEEAVAEEAAAGWETSVPCPRPPNTSMAEKSPRKGTSSEFRTGVATSGHISVYYSNA